MVIVVNFIRQPILVRTFGVGVGLFLTGLSASAQLTKPDSQPVVWVHDDKRDAQFPGGLKALIEYLRQHVYYPDSAAKSKITGKVLMSFLIDTTGQVSNPVILKSVGYGCDEEAVRVVKAIPRWIPGSQSGKPTWVKYNLPIVFPPE